MDGAGGEVQVALRDGGVLTKSSEEGDVTADSLGLHALAAGDVGVSLVLEQGRDELRLLGEGRRVVRAVQDVVGEDSRDQARVRGNSLHNSGSLEELFESSVGGSEDGNVLGLSETLQDGRLLAKEPDERRQSRVLRGQDLGEVRLLGKGRAGQCQKREILDLHCVLMSTDVLRCVWLCKEGVAVPLKS